MILVGMNLPGFSWPTKWVGSLGNRRFPTLPLGCSREFIRDGLIRRLGIRQWRAVANRCAKTDHFFFQSFRGSRVHLLQLGVFRRLRNDGLRFTLRHLLRDFDLVFSLLQGFVGIAATEQFVGDKNVDNAENGIGVDKEANRNQKDNDEPDGRIHVRRHPGRGGNRENDIANK